VGRGTADLLSALIVGRVVFKIALFLLCRRARVSGRKYFRRSWLATWHRFPCVLTVAVFYQLYDSFPYSYSRHFESLYPFSLTYTIILVNSLGYGNDETKGGALVLFIMDLLDKSIYIYSLYG
jgi:hypothetical protein